MHTLTQRQRELAALYRGVGVPRIAGAPPRVAVVGAGIAGLTAAHLLSLAGLSPAVFEASERTGGRIWTEGDNGAASPLWELGGEFIDSQHDDMHALADCFGLEMLDTGVAGEAAFDTAYRFGGSAYSNEQVAAAYAEVAPRIAADIAALSARPGHRSGNAADHRFDRMSIAEYLASLKLDRWLHDLLEVAYVTVYGLDAGEQSALNLLTLIGTDTRDGLELFGASDERFKIRAGSQRLTDALAARLGPRVFTGCRLVRLRRSGSDWVLTLAGTHSAVDVRADAVVLALPFTLLREVDLGNLLPPAQRLAVDTLGYGTSSKLMLGTQRRIWRDQGCDGGVYTDTPLQTSWDCSRQRADDGGVFTVFLGGREGMAVGQRDEAAQAHRFAAMADGIFPGFASQLTGATRRVHWASQPFAMGAYTCYRPGQWTSFGGAESTPLRGGLYFAGEHCATASQGYMNGAAETGRKAAMAIIRRLV
jgi:monoamine oxidase